MRMLEPPPTPLNRESIYEAIRIVDSPNVVPTSTPFAVATVTCCLCETRISTVRPTMALTRAIVIVWAMEKGWAYSPSGLLHARAWCPADREQAALAVA